MSELTPQLALPLIMPAQAQKHVTHNEAVELLDLFVQMTLESTTANVPPTSPAEGQAWALDTAPTGAWAAQGGTIATWRGGGWLFVAPKEGMIAWVKDMTALQVRTGGAWVTLVSVPAV